MKDSLTEEQLQLAYSAHIKAAAGRSKVGLTPQNPERRDRRLYGGGGKEMWKNYYLLRGGGGRVEVDWTEAWQNCYVLQVFANPNVLQLLANTNLLYYL